MVAQPSVHHQGLWVGWGRTGESGSWRVRRPPILEVIQGISQVEGCVVLSKAGPPPSLSFPLLLRQKQAAVLESILWAQP